METLTDKARIRAFLQRLLDKRSLLTIKLADSQQLFSSAIIEVDDAQEQFMLDELKPEQGNALLQQNPHLNLNGQLEGVVINFDTQVSEFGSEDGISFYKLPIPDAIEYHQRRQAVRIKLSAAHPLPVKFRFDNDQQLEGVIDDISIGGLRARFKTNLPATLESGHHLHCSFVLPPDNKEQLNCDFIVCAIKHEKNQFSLPFIGGQFVGLQGAAERQLQRAIMTLQRAIRQKENL